MTPSAQAAPAAEKPIKTTDAPFTPGSTKPPKAAPAAAAPAPAPAAKKGKSPAEKLNEQVRAFIDWASTTRALVAASLGEDQKGKHAGTLATASVLLDELGTAATKVQDALQALHKAKWEPPKARKPGDWRPGDRVAFKPRHVERFKSGYDAADLRSLVVLSVHGAMVKVQIERGGMKGEVLGLHPAYAFVAAKPEPAKTEPAKK